jgi:signal transduction histidine kinase
MLNKVKRCYMCGFRYYFYKMAAKKINMHWIKSLMLFSQVLLLVFTAQWLYSQYNDQQEQLKKNLTKIFTDVQHHITDSLLLTNVIDPIATTGNETPAATREGQKVSLSPQGLHKVLAGAANISGAEEHRLFKMDTIAFNEMFVTEMKHNGWDFSSQWINNSDSDKKASKAIFIRSSFFTASNGVVVDNYKWYLLWKLLPQMGFVLVLLLITGSAFGIMYRSLNAQIKLSILKDDFISNMSHELKTPIATVKVALEALNNFNIIDDPKLSREYLGMATSEMDRLELLATRVLTTSLLESGKIYLQQESHDLKTIVEDVLQTMQLRLQQHNATCAFTTEGNSFPVLIDKLHTQGVLVNLLDNSLKYGKQPVHIDIRLTEQNGTVQLSLTDNGPGIPEEYKERVFEKFFRVPTGNMHNTKGHGLGLSYAAQVMHQHSGSINVNNLASGGCVFTLTF